MQHDAGNALKAVLGLAEECCLDPVSFQADRQPGVHPVVDPASGLHHQPRLARSRRLRARTEKADLPSWSSLLGEKMHGTV